MWWRSLFYIDNNIYIIFFVLKNEEKNDNNQNHDINKTLIYTWDVEQSQKLCPKPQSKIQKAKGKLHFKSDKRIAEF